MNRITELQVKNASLKKSHQASTQVLLQAEKDKKDFEQLFSKEKDLNQMMTKKRDAENELIKLNTQRIEAFDHRLNVLYPECEKHLHNKKQEIKGNIRVFCRVRPVLDDDLTHILN